MPTITVGFLATLTKDGAQGITLLVHSFSLGKRPSACVTIEDGVNLGLTGGHPDPLELTFQSQLIVIRDTRFKGAQPSKWKRRILMTTLLKT